MFLGAFFLLLFYACFVGLSRDDEGLVFVLLVGFMQDPTRKVLEGEPVAMTVMVGVVIACMVIRQVFLSKQSLLEPFTRWTPEIKPALIIYLLLVALQAAHSLIRYGAPIVPALGAIFYLAPLIAISVGYSQFVNLNSVRQFLVVFSCLAVLVATSIVFSFFGVDSIFLGEVGSGLVIYDQGTILKAYSGLMRSSEIASWHMGASVCFLIIIAANKNSMPTLIAVSLAVILLMSSIVLTGRRKMILQILIFATLYFPVLRYYQGRLSNRFLSIVVLIFIVFMGGYGLLPSFEGTQYDLYVARSFSVFDDAGQRFAALGLGSIAWAYRVYGFFGGGLGVAAQGAQHFLTSSVTTSGAGEGGIGKLVSELGVISIFVIAWLAYTVAAYLHKCLKLVATMAPTKLLFVVGIVVFILANIPTFMVASQVFGDVFVLLILGLLTGSLFAIPRHVSTLLKSAK
jgi:hypothetical protein